MLELERNLQCVELRREKNIKKNGFYNTTFTHTDDLNAVKDKEERMDRKNILVVWLAGLRKCFTVVGVFWPPS